MVEQTELKRFMAIFRGNSRSYGECDPSKPGNKNMRTIKEPFSPQQFEAHLNGKMGLGVVPIRDDGMACWGAIDIDNHGLDKDLDLPAIESKVQSLNLPLIVCRSKSGGTHLFLFGQEPLRADMLKTILTRWMSDLRIDGSDCVFPKQTKLVLDNDGKRALGNWVNLPYFDVNKTNRYQVEGGKPCSFDLFLTNAEATAITQEQLENYFGSEHSEAPPCIRRALKEGVVNGNRNDTLFHITIYNHKRNPEGAREMTHAMQSELFTEPLPFGEADKTIRSAMKRSYGYLCKKEPWKEWCDKDTCRRVRYGVSDHEYEVLLADTKLPLFSELVKYANTEPVMWELKMNGVPITMTTDQLMDYRIIRMVAAEKLHTMLPAAIKASQWTDDILAKLMMEVRIEEAPIESSPIGLLTLRLEEFVRKADLTADGMDIRDREGLLRGMPIVQLVRNERLIMFRSVDYEDYLRRTHTDIPRNKDLWHKANRGMGVRFDRIRVKSQIVSVWCVSIDRFVEIRQEALNFDPEF